MRRTLRMRLAVLYGGVFFASGTFLLVFVFAMFWSGRSTRVSVPAPGQEVPGGSAIAERQHGIDLQALLLSSAAGLVLMVVLSFVFGWVIAGRALRPLQAMMATARAISASNLDSRIGLDSPYEEFKELGATFDDLFQRLDAAFRSQRHFVANASHELRTPLTVERTLLQVTLADPDASVETLRSTCEELLTLGATQERLVESLLTLAGSEQGVDRWEPFDLGAIAAQVIQACAAEAHRRDIRVDARLADAPSAGDPGLVESLVANLVGNAIRHNVAGGRVDVTTSRSSGRAIIAISNTGPVIPPGEVDRLFVPFQRLRRPRIRHAEGHGLGLAIVRAIATAHGATLTARAPDTGGLDVRVEFPAPRTGYPTSMTTLPNGPADS
jgi:signal transduction histidine kinase